MTAPTTSTNQHQHQGDRQNVPTPEPVVTVHLHRLRHDTAKEYGGWDKRRVPMGDYVPVLLPRTAVLKHPTIEVCRNCIRAHDDEVRARQEREEAEQVQARIDLITFELIEANKVRNMKRVYRLLARLQRIEEERNQPTT